MQTVSFSKTLKAYLKLHWCFRRSNKDFRYAGYLGTDGNWKHMKFFRRKWCILPNEGTDGTPPPNTCIANAELWLNCFS